VACLALSGSARVALDLVKRHPAIAGLAFISPVGVDASDLTRISLPLLVVVGAEDLRQPRVALAAGVTEAGGQFELVDDTDQSFHRNLPQVGSFVQDFLRRIGSNRSGVRS
jgi:hypothetical protein